MDICRLPSRPTAALMQMDTHHHRPAMRPRLADMQSLEAGMVHRPTAMLHHHPTDMPRRPTATAHRQTDIMAHRQAAIP
ncbi:hypothetical protein H4217_007158 [Coemansia sp. RSA 1939]|nr:hypothetical protein H4217_007158 [Coemansia sp. RSA 1939]